MVFGSAYTKKHILQCLKDRYMALMTKDLSNAQEAMHMSILF